MVKKTEVKDLVTRMCDMESKGYTIQTTAFEILDQMLVSLSCDKGSLKASSDLCANLADYVLKEGRRGDVLAVIFSNMAYIERQNDKRQDAIKTAITAFNIATGNFAKGRVLEELALIYRFLNPRDLDSAIAYGMASATKYAQSGSHIKSARANGIVGNCYLERSHEGDLAKAELYLQVDLDFNCKDESGRGKFSEGNARHGLGKLYLAQGKYEKAFEQFNAALEMYRTLATGEKKEFLRGTVTLLIYAACAASHFDYEKTLVVLEEADKRKEDSHEGDKPIIHDVLQTTFDTLNRTFVPRDLKTIVEVNKIRRDMLEHYSK